MTAIDCWYEVIINETQIQNKVKELGARITRDYEGKDLIIVGILKGSVVFLSDLIRSIDIPVSIDFISVSSYGCEKESSGIVRLLHDLTKPVKGRDILLVEDIVDTGLTLKYLMDNLSTREPRTIRICSLLDKKEARDNGIDLKIDYIGFTVPKKFLVGYGLDYDEKYRNLPFIAAIIDNK
ncbi:MAG: hypoxanthine phosphoribosyltransferase [Deltaproteobacteria bacterium]|nr:hypoxanthine phosphoribosyltransferase [Deltaproteobacteria bacterium]